MMQLGITANDEWRQTPFQDVEGRRMRRIVLVNYTTEIFSPIAGGSLSTFIWELCHVAQSLGAGPVVITQTHEGVPYSWEPTIYVDPPRLPINPWLYRLERLRRKLSRWPHLRQQVYANRLIRAIADHRLEEAAFVFQNDVEIAEMVKARFPKSRVLVLFQNYHRQKRLRRGALAHSVDQVAAVSRATGEWIEEVYGLPPGTVSTIYNGVDVEKFQPISRPVGERVIINFTGRVCPEKGLDTLLVAAEELAQRGHAARIELQFLGWAQAPAGTDSYSRQLEELAQRVRSAGIPIHRAGRVSRSDLPAYLAKADIHVTPSRWEEAFGLTTAEAMAAGLPVVATRTGGTPEVVGDAGRLFAGNDPSALADHLEELILNPGIREELGRKARLRALDFTWAHAWSRMSEFANQ